MGVQSFSSNSSSVSFGFKSAAATNKIESLDLTNFQQVSFTPELKDTKSVTEDLTIDTFGEGFLEASKEIAATIIQTYAHFTSGFFGVFEDIIDGAAVVVGEGVIWTSRGINCLFETDIDTDTMEQNLMDFTTTDWTGDYVAGTVDNLEFVQEYSAAPEWALEGAEFGGEVLGNAVLYTVSGGTGVALSALNGVGKGFNKAVDNGATFEEASLNAAIYGGISAATKYGVNQVSSVAKAGANHAIHTQANLASKIGDVVSTHSGDLLKGGAIGFSGSIAKNMSNYATYASKATDDNGNLKYANYAQYFDDTDAFIDAVGSGVSSSISVGYSVFGAAYDNSGKFASNLTKYASKTMTGEVAHGLHHIDDKQEVGGALVRGLANGFSKP